MKQPSAQGYFRLKLSTAIGLILNTCAAVWSITKQPKNKKTTVTACPEKQAFFVLY
ncbi:hypothetical protein [Neisseria yangbaofengii]|uniref:hypothetical protein n=1 Tax=Neisseria yangbaofengii TaxID=2709396 RepID=UPI0013ED3643|nr:hypothetical protein [Neisseria yangbaofengii]